MEILAGRLSWAHTRDVTAILLEIVGNLEFIELGCHPEIGEEQDHQRIKQEVPKGAFGELEGNGMTDISNQFGALIMGATEGLSDEEKELLGEHENGLRKNDGHNTSVIDAQRHEGSAAGIDFSADSPLRVLDGDLALGLGDSDDTGDDTGQQEQEGDGMAEIEFGGDCRSREEHVFERHPRLGKPGQNANGDDEGNAVAYATIGNLLPEPHQQHGPRGQDQHGLDAVKPYMRGIIKDELAKETAEDISRSLPLNGHKQTLAKAEQHREIAPVLNDLGSATFFARQFAQGRDYRGKQLDDDGRADVGHDAQSADRTMLESATGEQAVHAEHPTGTTTMLLKKSCQCLPI